LAVSSFAVPPPHRRLPLVTLYLTDRCNSRCITCDYWRYGGVDLSPAAVDALLPELQELGTELVMLSGGEPLLNPEWAKIAERLKSAGLEVWLLTSGLSLAKHARRAAEIFAAITVSLDGTDRPTYAAIRGLDAFDRVCEGVRAVAGTVPLNLRVTVQRANYRQLPAFVDLARTLGARQVSFLAVDVVNANAFGRAGGASAEPALRAEDLPELERIIERMERDYAAEFRSGFIAESPPKLRRILEYFGALRGRGVYPEVRCNVPEFSAVIDARGGVQPCFFIQGPAPASGNEGLRARLESAPMSELRADIRGGKRAECKTCVCSMWRELA
jgi:MoaA/NifB/PqqE/SkfB family radical SAM enzyme